MASLCLDVSDLFFPLNDRTVHLLFKHLRVHALAFELAYTIRLLLVHLSFFTRSYNLSNI